jgi:putative membrane protein
VKLGLLAIGLGGAALTALVAWFGARAIGHEVLAAGWAIPFTVTWQAGQLFLSALAWRIVAGGGGPRLGRWFRIRWIREAVNSLLPVAQLGGNLVGIRLLVQRGLSGQIAGAATTVDLTLEALTQFLFTLAGVSVLACVSADRTWVPWLEGGLVMMGLGLAGFVVAQRIGLLRLVEYLGKRLQRLIPSLSVQGLTGLHRELLHLQGDHGALLRAGGLHLFTWTLGTAETWLALTAMSQQPSLAAAFVIESLGVAARSAGFAVPAGLGVQEGGFILVGGLFGLGPDTAIALSMVKRVRELLIGVPGLLAWQLSEGKRLFARSRPPAR